MNTNRTAAMSAGPAAAASNAEGLRSRCGWRCAHSRGPGNLRGFTLVELSFVIGTLVLVMLVLPALFRPKRHGCGPNCISNLKQIGLAFRMWANDNDEKFPMHVRIAKGGTKELALQGLALPTFASISNELNNPKPLNCPQDSERPRSISFEQLFVTNLSYFFSMDASERNPMSILAGDRNVCVAGQLTNGLVQVTRGSGAAWGTNIHKSRGNIVRGDGSAHHLTDSTLRITLRDSGITTNHFIIP